MGMVLDKFVTERAHLLHKGASQHILLTHQFERSVIARVVARRLHDLQSFRLGRFFTSDPAYSTELSQALGGRALASRSAHIDGVDVRAKDILCIGHVCLEVVAVCFDEERSQFWAAGYQYHTVSQHSPSWRTARLWWMGVQVG